MNFSLSNFFESYVWILYFNGGAWLKNSGKIRNWGRLSDTVDIGLLDVDFVELVTLQHMLSNRVDKEEILKEKLLEVMENWETVYQGNLWQVQMTHI